ncbi:hypothetical protein B0H34DRAFT_500080 [Crassisporium funariophilum]|nr:hypothetical protein B0H34DRAFT_500080 [Crassisporium funariophilum]
MEGLGKGPSNALDSTYGAMFIGVLFATFFQGLLTVQTYNYFENFPTDPLKNKIIVAVVWCLDTTHLVFIAQSAYHYLVTNWGFQPALIRSTVPLNIQLTFIGLSSFVCQLFFLNRIWVFSHKNIAVVGFLLSLCITTVVLDILVTVQIISVPFVTEFGRRKGEIIAVFTTGAAADVLIAGFLCYYLRRDRSNFEATRSLVSKILQYTVATGLATSALAVGAVVAYFAQPEGFYFIAMHFSLGRMYTNALLATLNSRRQMRIALHAGQTTSSSRKETLAPGQAQENRSQYVSPFQPEVCAPMLCSVVNNSNHSVEKDEWHGC